MATYVYDGSFEGLLSCVFLAFKHKEIPNAIVEEQHYQLTLLDEVIYVAADEDLAGRVIKGVDERTANQASDLMYKMYLSELPQIELAIFYFIKAIVGSRNEKILENFANEYILKAAQVERMMHREVHRMHAFVRFQKANTGIFYAAIDPDFNVLPLIGDHFERRYADQHWIIVDTKRHYGLHYNLTGTEFIRLDDPILNFSSGDLNADVVDEQEKNYQAMWENYFHSVNIQERKNPKLHLRHVPKRYWKYLIEKKHRK